MSCRLTTSRKESAAYCRYSGHCVYVGHEAPTVTSLADRAGQAETKHSGDRLQERLGQLPSARGRRLRHSPPVSSLLSNCVLVTRVGTKLSCLLPSDAFDLYFGVVIFRLRAGFDATERKKDHGGIYLSTLCSTLCTLFYFKLQCILTQIDCIVWHIYFLIRWCVKCTLAKLSI